MSVSCSLAVQRSLENCATPGSCLGAEGTGWSIFIVCCIMSCLAVYSAAFCSVIVRAVCFNVSIRKTHVAFCHCQPFSYAATHPSPPDSALPEHHLGFLRFKVADCYVPFSAIRTGWVLVFDVSHLHVTLRRIERRSYFAYYD